MPRDGLIPEWKITFALDDTSLTWRVGVFRRVVRSDGERLEWRCIHRTSIAPLESHFDPVERLRIALRDIAGR